jgi:hypothetical protein
MQDRITGSKGQGVAQKIKTLTRLFLLVVLLMTSVVSARAASSRPVSALTKASVQALALQWFLQMQAGKIDRAQYTTAYSAQLTDHVVQEMSHHLNEYGAAPLRAEIVQTRSVGDQILYEMKMVFPRGDAASLLFGFNGAGKITGVAIMTMAGD